MPRRPSVVEQHRQLDSRRIFGTSGLSSTTSRQVRTAAESNQSAADVVQVLGKVEISNLGLRPTATASTPNSTWRSSGSHPWRRNACLLVRRPKTHASSKVWRLSLPLGLFQDYRSTSGLVPFAKRMETTFALSGINVGLWVSYPAQNHTQPPSRVNLTEQAPLCR